MCDMCFAHDNSLSNATPRVLAIFKGLKTTNKYLAFVLLISQLPSIPWIILSYFTIFLLGSAYLLFLLIGLHHTCRLAHLLLPFQLISLSLIPSFIVFHKALLLVPFLSISTQLRSVMSSSFPPSHNTTCR